MNFGATVTGSRPLLKAAAQCTKGFITGRWVPLYVGLFITPRRNLKCA